MGARSASGKYKRRSALVALILVASYRLCCLTTDTNHNHLATACHRTWGKPGGGSLSLRQSTVAHPALFSRSQQQGLHPFLAALRSLASWNVNWFACALIRLS